MKNILLLFVIILVLSGYSCKQENIPAQAKLSRLTEHYITIYLSGLDLKRMDIGQADISSYQINK